MHCLHILHIHFVTKQDQKSIDLALEKYKKTDKKNTMRKNRQTNRKKDRQIEKNQ